MPLLAKLRPIPSVLSSPVLVPWLLPMRFNIAPRGSLALLLRLLLLVLVLGLGLRLVRDVLVGTGRVAEALSEVLGVRAALNNNHDKRA